MTANKQTQGKKNRAAGARFELKVRKDLESKGWIVDKWSNTVKLSPMQTNPRNEIFYGELVPAKRKYNPFKKVMAIGTGFPDFIVFQKLLTNNKDVLKLGNLYSIFGIEVKSNGFLTKEEKEKCKWLLDNNTFSKILIASKGTKRGQIVYKEFEGL